MYIVHHIVIVHHAVMNLHYILLYLFVQLGVERIHILLELLMPILKLLIECVYFRRNIGFITTIAVVKVLADACIG